MSEKQRFVQIRINAWVFAFLAVLVVAIVAFVAGFQRVELLVGLAGVVAGGLVATIERLCAPEPLEPAPQPVTVPLEAYQELAAVTRSAVSAQPAGIGLSRMVYTREGDADDKSDETGG